jgi:DNA topoisomerase-1
VACDCYTDRPPGCAAVSGERRPSGPMTAHMTGRAAARDAGLRFSTDASPGLRRLRSGRGFTYVDADGQVIRDAGTIARIRSLAIPPAWTDVWICPVPEGHLQATGRDARGRKQYRYHARFRASREIAKFDRLLAFGRALPRIRARIRRDLARRGLPREKVMAAVVSLLERTLVRVGNEEYARLNRSFGLTTLKGRHASIVGTEVRFRFRGKGGRVHEVGIRDRRLASVIGRCQDLPGQDLFQYVGDDGRPTDVRSEDVNAYLREASGADITAKDFRTWAGTVLAYRALRSTELPATDQGSRRALVAAVREAAARLGNTVAVCRRSYVHPAVLDAYLDGRIQAALVAAAGQQGDTPPAATPAEEKAVLEILRLAVRRRPRRVQASSR